MMKAFFIDSASLLRMGRALNLRGGIFHPALYDILTKRIGREPTFRRPVITVHPNRMELIGKQLTLKGYEIIETTSIAQEDDRKIKERIKKLGSEVREIIIVSNDSDYYPELATKQAAGVRIIWVGTRAPNAEGKSSLGRLVEYYIAQGTFEFVELADFRDELEFTKPPMLFPGIRLVIQSRSPASMSQLLADIGPHISTAIDKYPDIQFSIEEGESGSV